MSFQSKLLADSRKKGPRLPVTKPFRNIKFGYAEAERESSYEPALLLHGFLDPNGLIKEATKGPRFLFLGYKGSGKSSIAEHLRLKSEADPNTFVSVALLSEFPYTDFGRIVGGDNEAESRFPTAWSWLLLLKLMDSFSRDEGANLASRSSLKSSLDVLQKLGLLPTPSLKEIVRTSSKKSFKLMIPKIVEAETERTSANDGIPLFVDKLKLLASKFRSESTHLLVIDGLDEVLSDRSVQYKSLASLMDEVNRLNLDFHRNQTPAKILVLCRTDLFERLPSANKNKLRQDCATHLEWYHDPRNPGESRLVKLANLRARLVVPEIRDLFATYFPKRIEDKEARTFLLDLTRHTPRDFLQLLSKIQEYGSEIPITREHLLSGLRRYSIDYFLPEIRDELHGYVSPEHIDLTLNLVGSLRKRDFFYQELVKSSQADSRFTDGLLEPVIRALFDCSAIGNIHNRRTGTTYYTFRYRNRNSTLNLDERLILHRGLWKALNIV